MKRETTQQARQARRLSRADRDNQDRERGTLTVKEVSFPWAIGRNPAHGRAQRRVAGCLRIGGRILISRIAFERMLSGEPL